MAVWLLVVGIGEHVYVQVAQAQHVEEFVDVEYKSSNPLVIKNFEDSYSCEVGCFLFTIMINGII